MINGMMFGGEGPVMSGTWYNPNTGDIFTVRDSFFEDNQYVVTTTDGRCLYYNQLQNYVQTDMKPEDIKKRNIENKKNEEVLPAEVANLIEEIDPNDPYAGMMSPDDLMIGNAKPNSFGNLADDRKPDYVQIPGPVMQTPSPTTMNEAIIEKALKNTSKPKIVVDVNWGVYPEKQIEMLKDVMEISEDEIIEWYLDNIDMIELVEALKTAIRYRILCKEGEVIQNKTEELIPTTQEINFEELKSEVKPKKPRKKKEE